MTTQEQLLSQIFQKSEQPKAQHQQKSGLNLLERAAIGTIKEGKGQDKYLKDRFDKVFKNEQGQYFVQDEKRTGGEVQPVDPKGFSLKDLGGDIAESVPSLLPSLIKNQAGNIISGTKIASEEAMSQLKKVDPQAYETLRSPLNVQYGAVSDNPEAQAAQKKFQALKAEAEKRADVIKDEEFYNPLEMATDLLTVVPGAGALVGKGLKTIGKGVLKVPGIKQAGEKIAETATKLPSVKSILKTKPATELVNQGIDNVDDAAKKINIKNGEIIGKPKAKIEDDLFAEFDPQNTIAKKAVQGLRPERKLEEAVNKRVFRGKGPDFVSDALVKGEIPASVLGKNVGDKADDLAADAANSIFNAKDNIRGVASQIWEKGMKEAGVKTEDMFVDSKPLMGKMKDLLGGLKNRILNPDEQQALKYLSPIMKNLEIGEMLASGKRIKDAISIDNLQNISSQMRNILDNQNISPTVQRLVQKVKPEIDALKYKHPGLAKVSPKYRQAMQAIDQIEEVFGGSDAAGIQKKLVRLLNEEKNSLNLKKLYKSMDFLEKNPEYASLSPKKEFLAYAYANTINKSTKMPDTGIRNLFSLPGISQMVTNVVNAPTSRAARLEKAVKLGLFDPAKAQQALSTRTGELLDSGFMAGYVPGKQSIPSLKGLGEKVKNIAEKINLPKVPAPQMALPALAAVVRGQGSATQKFNTAYPERNPDGTTNQERMQIQKNINLKYLKDPGRK